MIVEYTQYLLHVAHLICYDGGDHVIDLETEMKIMKSQSSSHTHRGMMTWWAGHWAVPVSCPEDWWQWCYWCEIYRSPSWQTAPELWCWPPPLSSSCCWLCWECSEEEEAREEFISGSYRIPIVLFILNTKHMKNVQLQILTSHIYGPQWMNPDKFG